MEIKFGVGEMILVAVIVLKACGIIHASWLCIIGGYLLWLIFLIVVSVILYLIINRY
jgi:hypothetical protein